MLRDVKKWKFISLMVGILLVFTAQAYGAKLAHPELLVAPADVEKNMGKWIVIDCRDAAATKDKKAVRR